MISAFAGCLVFAAYLGRDSAPQHGRLKVSVHAASESARQSALAGHLTIAGVDRPLLERAALSVAAEGSLDLSLPPGLYHVEWTAEDDRDVAWPEWLGASRMVVVAADRVSTVDVRPLPVPVASNSEMFVFTSSNPILAMR
jgi:hypothetical protein